MNNAGKAILLKAATEEKRREEASVSVRKLAANRRNALKSTGPKTARGKVCSRRNALKHGFFVNQVTD